MPSISSSASSSSSFSSSSSYSFHDVVQKGQVIYFDDGVHKEEIQILSDHIRCLYGGGWYAIDTTDGFHEYNIVVAVGGASLSIYIDNSPDACLTCALTEASSAKEIAFGDKSNTLGQGGQTNWDYITYDCNITDSELIYRGSPNEYTLVRPPSRTPGTYYIKAFNRSRIYSDDSVNVTPTNDAPATPSILSTQWFGFAKIYWTDSVDADLLYYELYYSPTNAWAGEESLESRVSGREAIVQGKSPNDAIADSADATSITDATLIGTGVNYFVGDLIKQTSGTYSGQESTITAFNNTTGLVTVASWGSGTPTIGDKFVLKDRGYYKVRGVDRFGAGSFSSAVTIDFTPLAEQELGDEVITARKIYSGEVITLSAQIKDAIITNAKINDLNADKIVTGTLNASEEIKVGSNMIISGGGYLSVFGEDIVIETDVNDVLDWIEDSSTLSATIDPDSYTPAELAAEVQVEMRAAGDNDTTVTYNTTTKLITIANSTLTTLSLLFYSGTDTSQTIGQALGFLVTADKTGALTYAADEEAALRVKIGLL